MYEVLDDEIDFAQYLQDTDAKTKVRPAGSWADEAKKRLIEHAQKKKIFLPWEKTNEFFDFRGGEVTLWSGQNGHGKSQMVSQVALSLMGQGQKVCIASFEMKPVVTIQRMVRMHCGTNPKNPEYQGDQGLQLLEQLYDEFFGFCENHLWIYDQNRTAETEIVIGMARYCAKELGINQIVIDNLAKCVKGEDDYNTQKYFVDELTSIARDYNCHIHLVHHLKKPSKESDVPDKHDNKGSGAITDLADNVMMIWRNKPKEDDIKLNGARAKKIDEPDQYLLCRKQRNYEGSEEGEPTITLWFNKDSGQYLGHKTDQPMFFANYPHKYTSF